MPAAQNPYGSSPGLSQSDAGSEQVHNFFDFTDDFTDNFIVTFTPGPGVQVHIFGRTSID